MASILNLRLKLRAIRLANCEDDNDDETVEDMKDIAVAGSLRKIKRNRYFSRPTKYRKSPAEERFRTDLNADKIPGDGSSSESEMPWLTDDEFVQKYRVSRKAFQYILDQIQDHLHYAKS